jgi:hypothetical protein
MIEDILCELVIELNTNNSTKPLAAYNPLRLLVHLAAAAAEMCADDVPPYLIS